MNIIKLLIFFICIYIIFHFIIYLFKFNYNYTVKERKKIPYIKRKKILNDFIKIVYKIAHQNNLHPIIYYGTLLGFIREKNIICYDFDIDLIIDEDEYDILVNEIKKYFKNSKKYKINEYKYITDFLVIICNKTKLNCDISKISKKNNYFRRNVNNFYTKYILKECNVKHSLDKLYPLKTGILNGVKIYYPNNPKYFLKCFYGNDYLKPTYKCGRNCTNCVKNL
jgi:hypothetical protein